MGYGAALRPDFEEHNLKAILIIISDLSTINVTCKQCMSHCGLIFEVEGIHRKSE
jgi:peptide methionine sulfoxide reductase MsrB